MKSGRYVEHIKKFMKPGTKILLDLFESYDDDGNVMMKGGFCLVTVLNDTPLC